MSNQTFFGKEIRSDIRDTQVTQIYNILVGEIASKRWAINSRFPSVTQLVNQSGLSRGSIQKVLARLESDRLIATESRRGTFIIAFEPATNPLPEKPEIKAAPTRREHPPKRVEKPSPALAELAGFATAALRTSPPSQSPIAAPVVREPAPVSAPIAAAAPPPSQNPSSPLPIFDNPADTFAPISEKSPISSIPDSPSKSDSLPHSNSIADSRIGIALIKSDPQISSEPHQGGESLLEALLGSLPEFGYRSSVAFLERSPDWDILAADGGPFDDSVDGIIALSSGGFIDFTEPSIGCCPVVFLSGSDGRSLPCVTRDFSLGAFRATRDLIAAGHSRIIVCPESGFHPAESNAFLEGHREAMRRVGLPVDEKAITLARNLQYGDFASLRQFLQQFRDATAILCGSPRRATDLIALCDALGLQVPEDLSIVTTGRTPMRGDFSGETVSGFEFPPEKLAHAALLLLDECLHTGSSRFSQVRIPPVKIPGNTVAPPRR